MQKTVGINPHLIHQALAGDSPSRERLAHLARARIYPYINRITLDAHGAHDLTQETMLAIFNSLPTLRCPDRFWPWALTIATNKARQHFRSESRRPTVPLSSLTDAIRPSVTHPATEGITHLAAREIRQRINAALATMCERYRLVLILRAIQGRSHAEIARVIGCSEQCARATFFRARRALQRELKRHGLDRDEFAA
jgi:RNA polymerase sigma-70 factor (ECF subfamily)